MMWRSQFRVGLEQWEGLSWHEPLVVWVEWVSLYGLLSENCDW